ncbi:hypothetical protein L7F22_024605 [Adiantum nelumboides]|nr:hypothetical protein [Adiantum nelumboides]
MATKEDTIFNIEKLDGTNFSYWKDQIWDVLVQKKQIQPLKLQGVKPENMESDDWEKLDDMCRSTIRLSLSKSVYYNVKDAEGGACELWQRICDMYDKHLATSMVHWIKKLIDLQMEKGASMNAHLNELNTIFSQLAMQKITFENKVKAMFLLVTLPESWDTFRIAISNTILADELSTKVESSLLIEATLGCSERYSQILEGDFRVFPMLWGLRRLLGSLSYTGQMDPNARLGGVRFMWANLPTHCKVDAGFGGVPLWNASRMVATLIVAMFVRDLDGPLPVPFYDRRADNIATDIDGYEADSNMLQEPL